MVKNVKKCQNHCTLMSKSWLPFLYNLLVPAREEPKCSPEKRWPVSLRKQQPKVMLGLWCWCTYSISWSPSSHWLILTLCALFRFRCYRAGVHVCLFVSFFSLTSNYVQIWFLCTSWLVSFFSSTNTYVHRSGLGAGIPIS